MKNKKNSILPFLITPFLSIYFLTAYVQMNFNPALWDQEVRMLHVFLLPITLIISVTIYASTIEK